VAVTLRPEILADEMRAPRERIVAMLCKAYWMEIEKVMNFLASSINPGGTRAREIIASLHEDIEEELGHATEFATRISELSGMVPGSMDFRAEQAYLQPPRRRHDIVHVIKGVIAAEKEAIEHYVELMRVTNEVDPVTHEIVAAIVHDEQRHLRLFESFLRDYAR
jgi:bacterioferritin